MNYDKYDRGEVLEIDTWVGASGKNGMRRDWLIRSQATGRIFARATRLVFTLKMLLILFSFIYLTSLIETIYQTVHG